MVLPCRCYEGRAGSTAQVGRARGRVRCFSRVPQRAEPTPAPKRRTTTPKTPKPPARRNRRLVHILLLFVAAVIVVDGLVGDRGR